MKKLALITLALVFALSLNLTWAQDATNSDNVKKPDVTKPSTLQKSTDVTTSKAITKPVDAKTLGATQSNNPKKDRTPSGIKTDVVGKGTGKPVNSLCLVSGEKIDSKITADYKGITYAFCCKTCLKKFTKNPDKYVIKYDKETLKLKN